MARRLPIPGIKRMSMFMAVGGMGLILIRGGTDTRARVFTSRSVLDITIRGTGAARLGIGGMIRGAGIAIMPVFGGHTTMGGLRFITIRFFIIPATFIAAGAMRIKNAILPGAAQPHALILLQGLMAPAAAAALPGRQPEHMRGATTATTGACVEMRFPPYRAENLLQPIRIARA